MTFVNKKTGEELNHHEFIRFCWDETERQFEECGKELWCNLNKSEQIKLYCIQFEHQLHDMNWTMQWEEV